VHARAPLEVTLALRVLGKSDKVTRPELTIATGKKGESDRSRGLGRMHGDHGGHRAWQNLLGKASLASRGCISWKPRALWEAEPPTSATHNLEVPP